MKNVCLKRNSLRGMALFLGLAALAGAQPRPWTTVGSAGTTDDADTSEVRFTQGEATLAPAAAVGTVSTIRYNIVATNDLGVLGTPRLTIRYRTGDGSGRVIVRLKRYNYSPGGGAVTVATFDSNAHAATGSAYTTRTMVACGAPAFAFASNAYFIEVEMQKNGALGNPGLGVVKVDIVQPCGA
jgi:hypothetical protein